MKLLLFNTNIAVRSALSKVMEGDEYVVLTDQENIFSLLQLLNYQNVILRFVRGDYSLKDLGKLKKAKDEIKQMFKEYNIEELHYYHQAFGGFYNWIIYYASKQNTAVLYQRVFKRVEGEPSKTLKALKTKILYSFLFKADVEVIDVGGGHLSPRLTDSFKTNNGIIENLATWNVDVIKRIGNDIAEKLNLSYSSEKVLLLTGSILSTGQVQEEEYEEKMGRLIESIGPERIICKCHPRFDDEIEIEKQLQHIPSFVPMELLISMFSVVIGYGSSVLLNAADEGIVAISLIDFFSCRTKLRQTVLHNYFEGHKVSFIKNIEEIDKLTN